MEINVAVSYPHPSSPSPSPTPNPAGYGMRQDGIGYSGMVVTPYYDSLLVKYTARGATWEEVSTGVHLKHKPNMHP